MFLLRYLGLGCMVLVDIRLSLSCSLPVELNPWALHRQIQSRGHKISVNH